MSTRRTISFSEKEKDLEEYFDNNGKSDLAKDAIRFYKENKDKLMVGDIKELIQLIGSLNVNFQNPQTPQNQRNIRENEDKIKKLFK